MSDDELTRQQAYCFYRRKGYTDTEAADKAGFSSRPSQKAYNLWDKVKDIPADDVFEELVDTVNKIEHHRFELKELRRKKKALEVLRAMSARKTENRQPPSFS